jgi:Domain of unknown function (DUF4349)
VTDVQGARREASHLMALGGAVHDVYHTLIMLTPSIRSLLLVVCGLLIACGDSAPSRTDASFGKAGGEREMAAVGAAPPATPARPASDADLSQQTTGRDPSQVPVSDTAAAPSMLIRTGNAQIEVDSLEIAMQQVRDLAQRLGGFIANTQLSSGRDQIRSASMEMKIPVARWTQVLEGLKPIGKVEALNEFTQDVGEEYVDVTARVQNAKRLEGRLIELLANRTGRLSDVLSVERELARVREEIERYEGRLRYLRTRAAMSSMSVTVHEAFPVVSARGETGVLGDAFKQAWRNFVGFIAGIISLTGILIPLAAIGVLAWLVWRRWWRRRPPPRSDAPPSTA